MTTFGSVCSGIEAASVAWRALGWRPVWFAEVDAFASAVLAWRHPGVPNLGDMRSLAAQVRAGAIEAPDVLVGGTPCQAFSVAGLRAGLADARGQLVFAFLELADAIDAARAVRGRPPSVVVWENVPGVLSDRGNAFGHFLAGLAGEGCALEPPRDAGRRRVWGNAGAVFGPARTAAWRVLDAQYFGVAQRRRRCFVVASARARFDPAAVLFDAEGVRRDSAPSRDAGQGVAGTLSARASAGSGLGTDFELTGGLQAVAGTLDASGGGVDENDAKDGRLVLCMAHGQGGAEVGEGHSPTLTCQHEAPIVAACAVGRGDMDDAAPCVAVAFKASHFTRGKDGAPSEVAPPLSADADRGDQDTLVLSEALAFSCKDDGHDAACEVTPTLRAMNFDGSHANGGGQLAVVVPQQAIFAFDTRQDPVSREDVSGALQAGSPQAQAVCVAFAENSRAEVRLEGGDGDRTGALSAGGGKPGQGVPMVAVAFQTSQSGVRTDEVHATLDANNGSRRLNGACYGYEVRRLTPVECERLQGFPDGYTRVPYRGQMAADTPRYRVLGNSMAVPCMRWLGRRIAAELGDGTSVR